MAQRLQEKGESITINCVCPGIVPTPSAPRILVQAVPEEYITPESTVVRAIEGFVHDSNITGQAAECSGEEIHYRPILSPSNKAAEYVVEAKYKEKIGVDAFTKGMIANGAMLDGMQGAL